MSNFRSSALLLLSGAFSLTLLTGCPNAGTQPGVPTQGSSVMPGSPDATASAPATASSAAPTGTESAAPTTAPSTSPLEASTVRGKVYDEEGAAVSGAKVRVRSLNSANPFDSTVDVTAGSYVVNNVPAGVQLEITAMKDNWTKRTRVETLLPLSSTQANVVNFGGLKGNNEDADGAAYFISNYPEISSASAAVKEDAKATYTITLSEPLDEINRRRFENALSLSAPDPNGGFVTVKKGSTFLGDRVQPTFTWDSTGTVLTFAFDAPLLARSSDKTNYALRLTRGTGDDLIEDGESKTLGRIATAPGTSYAEAFKLSTPLVAATDDPADRWAAGHTSNSNFDLPEDNDKPVLTAVNGSPVTVSGVEMFRFSLTFNEPMRVYPEATGFSSTVTNLANYYFALGEDDVDGVDMDGTAGTVATAADATAAMNASSVFHFAAAPGGGLANSVVEFSTSDPKVVYVSVDRNLVPSEAKAFKVRVDNVADPVGNAVSTGNKVTADDTADNIKMGAI